MKNKNSKHYVTIHQRLERFFRHRAILSAVLIVMGLGLIKYETRVLGIVQEMYYGRSGDVLSSYVHNQETTRMPVNYGTNRMISISGE